MHLQNASLLQLTDPNQKECQNDRNKCEHIRDNRFVCFYKKQSFVLRTGDNKLKKLTQTKKEFPCRPDDKRQKMKRESVNWEQFPYLMFEQALKVAVKVRAESKDTSGKGKAAATYIRPRPSGAQVCLSCPARVRELVRSLGPVQYHCTMLIM